MSHFHTAFEQLALGHSVIDIRPLDDDDQLAKAFDHAMQSYHSLMDAAEQIAAGDFLTEIEPRSYKDQLAIALQSIAKSFPRLDSGCEDRAESMRR